MSERVFLIVPQTYSREMATEIVDWGGQAKQDERRQRQLGTKFIKLSLFSFSFLKSGLFFINSKHT